MFFTNCENTYSVDNKIHCIAKPGDIAYIPSGAVYSCTFHNNNIANNNNIPKSKETENYYINGIKTNFKKKIFNAVFIAFDIFDSEHNPIDIYDDITILKHTNTQKIKSQFEEIAFQMNNGIPSPLKINILLYKILLELSKDLQKNNTKSKNALSIQPAINYINSHNLSEITIPELANICNMSISGFREKFRKELGISPINYIAELKIQKAKSMLLDENMSVASIALNLGFSDVGYFSKFYKKHTGHNPSKRY